MQTRQPILSWSMYIKLTLLAWLAMIGVDFLLHAAVLARFYLEPSPFLLPPQRAFALIPVGYLSFLILAFLLVWLMARLGITGWRQGGVFGLQFGALAWGALILKRSMWPADFASTWQPLPQTGMDYELKLRR